MPTIPRFHCDQDEEFVYIHVHVPYVRVSDMDFHVSDYDFTFYCKPYLLKLTLPDRVVDDDRTKAVYDVNQENGVITVHLPKFEKGLYFKDLDMITKLLQKKSWKLEDIDISGQSPSAPLIEIINSTEYMDENNQTKMYQDQDLNLSSYDTSLMDIEKTIEKNSENISVFIEKIRYGFNNRHCNFFQRFHGEVSEILSLPDPDKTPECSRKFKRMEWEEKDFDMNRYLGDLVYGDEDPLLQEMLKYEPKWFQYSKKEIIMSSKTKEIAKLNPIPENEPFLFRELDSIPENIEYQGRVNKNNNYTPSMTVVPEENMDKLADRLESVYVNDVIPPLNPKKNSSIEFSFSTEELEMLKNLPNREYLVDNGTLEEKKLLCGIIDILIGYIYDDCLTQGDPTVESNWNISILSPTLSWLDTPVNVNEVVSCGISRVLCYPYLRRIDVAKKVIYQCAELLKRGKRVLLSIFLSIYGIFQKSETRYLLCPLYLEDYCVWIQSLDEEKLIKLAEEIELELNAFEKKDLRWNIQIAEDEMMESKSSIEDENGTTSEDYSGESSDYSGESSDYYEESSDEELSSNAEETRNQISYPVVQPHLTISLPPNKAKIEVLN